MKRVVFNQKGGVGKTSIACNLAAAMAKLGRKVLVIDLDSQANASQYLLGDTNLAGRATIADFFTSTLSFKIFKDSLGEALCASPYDRLWVIPASLELAELQPKLEARYKIFKLSQAVEELAAKKGFNEIIIDTPPALNFYSMSALMTADSVIIPFDCDAFSARAVVKVMETVEEVADDHRPDLRVEGIIINHFQPQARLPRETVDALMSKGFKVLTPYLASSVLMKESHERNIPIVHLRPTHKLALEFMALAEGLVGVKARKPVAKPVKAAEEPV